MIVMIDNYDSFTYNLVDYLHQLGAEVQVFRHDGITTTKLHPLLVISFGFVDSPAVGFIPDKVLFHLFVA